jgi:hypothetical protein
MDNNNPKGSVDERDRLVGNGQLWNHAQCGVGQEDI